MALLCIQLLQSDTMSTQTLLWAVIWAICTEIDRCPDVISTSTNDRKKMSAISCVEYPDRNNVVPNFRYCLSSMIKLCIRTQCRQIRVRKYHGLYIVSVFCWCVHSNHCYATILEVNQSVVFPTIAITYCCL